MMAAFEEKRNLQDLWKAAFPIGTEREQLDALYEINWDFKHLQQALEEEAGMLYGKKVYVFVETELHLFRYKGVSKLVHVPVVVAIESPFPPSDKIGIKKPGQIQGYEIVPMKQMKLDWVPYVAQVKFQIFTLSCTEREVGLSNFNYCLPYFYQPFEESELEQSTTVDIFFPSEPTVVCEFDWEEDYLEGFVDTQIEEEAISAEQRCEFKESVKEQIRAAKNTRREARDARRKAIQDMSQETRHAFQNIKFYKFYPQQVSAVHKSPFINRYYKNAHQVL